MIPRRVAAAWDRLHRAHPEPTQAPLTLAEQRLPRVMRVTRVALNVDTLLHLDEGKAVACHIEEWDMEFLYHLGSCRDAGALFVRAVEQLEVQS